MPTAYQVAARFVREAVELATRYPDHTRCLGVNGVLAGSEAAEPIRQALIECRANGEVMLHERFERAKGRSPTNR